jgi:hypothetical protein
MNFFHGIGCTSKNLNEKQPDSGRRRSLSAGYLQNRVDVGSLRRRREIADGHVLDHAAPQRAHLGHLKPSCPRGGCNTQSSQTGRQSHDLAAPAAIAASFNPDSQQALDNLILYEFLIRFSESTEEVLSTWVGAVPIVSRPS